MPAQFDIIEVLNTKSGSDSHALVFKVEWADNHQIAYMHFDMAKKKYPHIVLDYLASRIKQKPIQSFDRKKIQSPVTTHSQLAYMIQGEEKKTDTKIQSFFANNSKALSGQHMLPIFDCDSVIPSDDITAYAVFFKLSTRARRCTKKAESKGLASGKIQMEQTHE